MKPSTNPDKKPRATRRKKPIPQSDDLTADERRAIAAAQAGGPAENATIRISPLLRETAALAMAARGLSSLSEYINLLLARDAVRTMVDLDSHPGEPTSALDLVLGTWAADSRRRAVNRVQLLREDQIPADQRMQADALRSFMKSAAAQAGRPVSRDELSDVALDEWDAIVATIGAKHIDRAALAACAVRAAARLRAGTHWPGEVEQALAELRAKNVPPELFIDALTTAMKKAAEKRKVR